METRQEWTTPQAVVLGLVSGLLGVLGILVVGFALIRFGFLDGSAWVIDGSVWGSAMTLAGVVIGTGIGFGIGAYHRSPTS